jgi:hypothetical protein
VSGDVKVYDGLTEYVASSEEAERVRRTLYRTDASARASVVAEFHARLEPADLERFHSDGYLAMEGVLAPDEVASCAGALDDLARRRPEGVGVQEEPYYQQAWQRAGQQSGPDSQAIPPELRVRKLWKFAGADPVLGAAVAAPRMMAIVASSSARTPG